MYRLQKTSIFYGWVVKNFKKLITTVTKQKKDVMGKVYEILVRDKLLIGIENLEESKKIELVKECRETGIQFTNRTLTDAAKILHVVKFING